METNNEGEKIREARVIVGKESFEDVYDVSEEKGLLRVTPKPGIRVVAVEGYGAPSEEQPASAQEQAQDEWVEETMMQFPFAESERYSEWKAFQALVRNAWRTPARECIEDIVTRSKLLPNSAADLSTYLREQHRAYLTLFEKATNGDAMRMERYMFALKRRTLAESIACEVWPHYGPFGFDEVLTKLEADPSFVHPDSVIWTWEEFWDAVGTKLDEDLQLLGYYVVLRWLQRQLFNLEKAVINGLDVSTKDRDTLAACFEYHSRYVTVMKLLVDNDYCHPVTHYPTEKLNKSLLCGLIESLHALGYYGKAGKPSETETILIAKNTFGVFPLSKGTVKGRVKDSKQWAFIPPANAL